MSLKDKLPGVIGFGTAPLGNMFRNIPEAEAAATVDAAWAAGVRYFDTAPFYGAGLSETRLGDALKKYNRDEYVLSTKVGRVILDELEDPLARDMGEKGGLFEFGLKNKIVNDYSADATLRSNRVNPSFSSSWAICRLSGDCEMCSRSAARPTCSSSATATKYCNWRISSMSDPSGLKVSKLCLGRSVKVNLHWSHSLIHQEHTMSIREQLQGKLGFGTAPLGNMYRDIAPAEAIATVDAAWDQGIRFFDTAPLYGAGLAEIRLGEALARRPRDE